MVCSSEGPPHTVSQAAPLDTHCGQRCLRIMAVSMHAMTIKGPSRPRVASGIDPVKVGLPWWGHSQVSLLNCYYGHCKQCCLDFCQGSAGHLVVLQRNWNATLNHCLDQRLQSVQSLPRQRGVPRAHSHVLRPPGN